MMLFKQYTALAIGFCYFLLFPEFSLAQPKKGVSFKHKPDKQSVEIFLDGQHFTTYLYQDALKKPVLYPILTQGGGAITRGYPFSKVGGERVDHRHHLGHWLNYGNVNGLDFWNNSADRPAERRHRYGEIRHQEIVEIKEGNKEGVLSYRANWVDHQGKILLKEETTFKFHQSGNTRIIDRQTKLQAEVDAAFTDNKEGMIAIRVGRALELPSDGKGWYADANGNPLSERTVNTKGAGGDYLSSEGLTGNDVWGSRAEWVKLFGTIGEENVSLAILDHPDNVGYPTYWHARGYGLFSANPLGQKVFSKGKEELNFGLKKGETVSFKYRILIHEGSELTVEHIEKLHKKFKKN